MAKYTETLGEYLDNGGTLPAVFSQIEGFEELFTANYVEREIGSETEDLFKIKLELTANLVIPRYADRIAQETQLREILLNPNKKHVRTGNTARTRDGQITRTTGATDDTTTNTRAGSIVHTVDVTDTAEPNNQKVTVTELPFTVTDPSQTSPSNITSTDNGKTVQTNHQTDEEKFNNYSETAHTTGQARTDTESYTGYQEQETYNDITEAEEGLTASEVLAIMDHYENNINIILQQLLNEFNNNFMVIY